MLQAYCPLLALLPEQSHSHRCAQRPCCVVRRVKRVLYSRNVVLPPRPAVVPATKPSAQPYSSAHMASSGSRLPSRGDVNSSPLLTLQATDTQQMLPRRAGGCLAALPSTHDQNQMVSCPSCPPVLAQLTPLVQDLPEANKKPSQHQQKPIAAVSAAAIVQGLQPLPLRRAYV